MKVAAKHLGNRPDLAGKEDAARMMLKRNAISNYSDFRSKSPVIIPILFQHAD